MRFYQIFHEVGDHIISYLGYRLSSLHGLLNMSKDGNKMIKQTMSTIQCLTLSSTKLLKYITEEKFKYLQKLELCLNYWDDLRYKMTTNDQFTFTLPHIKDISFYGMDINTGKMAYFANNDIPLNKEEHIVLYLLRNTKKCLNEISIHNVPIKTYEFTQVLQSFDNLHHITLRACLSKIVNDLIIDALTPTKLKYLYIEDCSISSDQIKYLETRLLKSKHLKFCILSFITPVDYNCMKWKKL